MPSSYFQQQQQAAQQARQSGAVQQGGGFRAAGSVSSQPVFNSKTATFGPTGQISSVGGGSTGSQYYSSPGQIVNQPGAIVGAPGANSFDAFGNPLNYDYAQTTRNAIVNGQQQTPLYRNSSGQLVSATPSIGASSGPLLALSGSSASLGLPPTIQQFAPISAQQVGEASVPQIQPLQPVPDSATGTDVGQILNQATGQPLSPSEFERLREATGATDETFNLFFERVGKDIFARSAGLTGQAPLTPSEFSSLRKNLGVGSDNFDEFFERRGNDIYYKRSNLAGSPAEVFNASASGPTNIFDSTTLSLPESNFPDFTEESITDPVAWIRSLSDIYQTTQTDFQLQLQQQQQMLFEQMQQQQQEISNISQRRRDLDAQYGLEAQVKTINELNLTIQQKTAEFEQGMFNIGQQTTAAPFIAGQQQAFQQQAALEIGALVGTQQALIGNFELATSVIDRSIEYSFRDLELQIGMTRDFLAINQDQMSREEKKQSFVIENILNERQRIIDEQKAEKQEIKNLMLSLAEIGGDPRKIDLNKSFAENAQVYSQQRAIFDEQQRNFEIEKAKALSTKQLITDGSGRPVGTFDGLTGDIEEFSASGYVQSIGPITGYGSPYWEYGLDIDLTNGQEVYSPVSGTVSYIRNDSYAGEPQSFGNQVKIVADDGSEIWLSHLQMPGVTEGQRINAGQFIGTGGNTGSTIPGKGGDGSHLDITIVKPDGSYMDAYSVESYLNSRFSNPESGGAGVASGPTPSQPFAGVDFRSPAEISREQALQQEQQVQDQEQINTARKQTEALQQKLDNIKFLQSSEGMTGSVGAYWFSRLTPLKADKAARAEFMSRLSQLVDQESISKLLDIKAAGGTFGQLSDKELAVLRSSATAINNWIERDEAGQPTGNVIISEQKFTDELNRLQIATENTISQLQTIINGGTDLDSLINQYLQ